MIGYLATLTILFGCVVISLLIGHISDAGGRRVRNSKVDV